MVTSGFVAVATRTDGAIDSAYRSHDPKRKEVPSHEQVLMEEGMQVLAKMYASAGKREGSYVGSEDSGQTPSRGFGHIECGRPGGAHGNLKRLKDIPNFQCQKLVKRHSTGRYDSNFALSLIYQSLSCEIDSLSDPKYSSLQHPGNRQESEGISNSASSVPSKLFQTLFKLASNLSIHESKMKRLGYSVTRSYSVGRGETSDISLEFRTITPEPRTAPECDLAGERVLPFHSSACAELKKNTRELEEALESDIVKLERTIDTAVETLIAAIRLLDAGIRERTRTVTRNKAILAPIRRLPPEILRQVLAYTESAALPKYKNVLCSKMLVCKAWCQIILDLPHLWTRFDLTKDDFRGGRREKFLCHSLARANFAPLDVTITISNPFLYLSSASTSLLKNVMSRCTSLDLRLSTYVEEGEFYEEEVDCIFEAIEPSKLIHFSISISNSRDVQLEDFLNESIAVQQSLSRMQHHLQSLEIHHEDFMPGELRMYVLKILKLHWTRFDNEDLRKWTVIAPNLHHLCIMGLYTNANWDEFISSPSCFHQVHFLELHPTTYYQPDSWKALLTACSLIQTLLLDDFSPSIRIPLFTLQTLKLLVIPEMGRPDFPEYQPHLDQHLVRWFSCMPNLERLEIANQERGPGSNKSGTAASSIGLLLTALTPKNISNPRICPRLTSLIYTLTTWDKKTSGLPTDAIDTIVALSRSRQEGSQQSCLKVTVTLEYDSWDAGARHSILRTTIVEDTDYNDLLHTFQMKSSQE